MKLIRHVLIFTLSTALFFSALPTIAYTEDTISIKPIDPDTVLVREEVTSETDSILYELVDQREENIKHYITQSGRFKAAIYESPIHYLVDGKWIDIDNRLVDGTDSEKNPVFTNQRNTYDVQIAKNSQAKKLVNITKEKYSLSWNIEQSKQSISKVVVSASSSEILTSEEKKTQLNNLYSKAVFSEIFPNIDLEYLVEPDCVKENLILKKPTTLQSFAFNYTMKGLKVIQQKDNTILFVDENDSNKIVFKIDVPFMYDARNEESRDILMSLKETATGVTLTLNPDQKWLNSSERVYPITIDPPVYTSLDPANIDDVHISQGLPTTNFGNSYIVKTGYGVSSLINRTFIKFALPALSSSDMVISAQLYLVTTSTSSFVSNQVNVHKVTQNWSEGSVTWNNQPAINASVEDYAMVSVPAQYTWNVTSIVKDWYTSGNNFGLSIHNQKEGVGYKEYYSADTGTPYASSRPQVVIYYVNNNGLESYWTYHSQSVGRAGTGYVNDYNGNLVFTRSDTVSTGNLMPVSLTHIYNSHDRSANLGFGNGWRLNLSQTVFERVISGTTYYVWTDEDGTQHYFAYDSTKGKYMDESGSQLSITKTGTIFTLNDTQGNTSTFNADGTLQKITNANGSVMSLTYVSGKLASATDGANRTTNLAYNSNGLLSTITDPAARVTIFGYGSNPSQLTSITDPDGSVVTYNYDIKQLLLSAKNFDGYQIAYTEGNVGTPTRIIPYVYGDTNWKDKLTSFDGKAITYDAIGNPLTYDGSTMTWEQGRRLASYTKTGLAISYTYNENGIRTSKTVNGVTTTYRLSGSQVTYESNGTDSLYYTYDTQGQLVSVILNGTEYAYVRNGQNDITGLIDNQGNQVVSYTYGTWGQPLTITGSLASSLGVKNPYRYRGYRFDTETGLYYLQSRYYSPQWGRFINADSQLNPTNGLVGTNMFAYGGNNVVNVIDSSGHCFMFLTAAIGLIAGAVIGGAIAASQGSNVLKGALIGAAIGGLVGLGAGAAAGVVLAGSATASTVAVLAGGSALAATIGSGGLAAGGKLIVDNISRTVNTGGGQATTQAVSNGANSKEINSIINLERVGSALKPDAFHAFPDIVDNYAGLATQTSLGNATLYQLQGSLTLNNGIIGQAISYDGRFEWIVQAGQVTHRLFVVGGGINGIPIMR